MKFLAKHYFGLIAFFGITTCTTFALASSGPTKQLDTRSNLKQLGTALMMYAQDYDECLPPMHNAAQVQQLLSPYLENESAFINPHTKNAFGINFTLSGRQLEAVYQDGYQNKQGIIVFYEASPRVHGARFALRMAKPFEYLNDEPVWAYTGKDSALQQPTVESISQLEWVKAKEVSRLP